MKVQLLTVGKSTDKNSIKAQAEYEKRLKHYIQFSITEIPALKNTSKLSQEEQKSLEAKEILKRIPDRSHIILLDEKGEQFTSRQFSQQLQQHMNSGIANLIFIIGGPYGFAPQVYQKSNSLISLSKMTFSHQMIRIFFIEQLYRGMTILRNEPYHHD